MMGWGRQFDRKLTVYLQNCPPHLIMGGMSQRDRGGEINFNYYYCFLTIKTDSIKILV
jgi:hypothetical protein